MLWTFDGPDERWLKEKEFAAYLGIGLDLFREMVKAGTIPPPRKWTGKTRQWHGEVVLWVEMGIKLGVIDPENLAARSQGIEGE